MPEPVVVEKTDQVEDKVILGAMGNIMDLYTKDEEGNDLPPLQKEEEEVVVKKEEEEILDEKDEKDEKDEVEEIDYSTFEKDDLVSKVIEFEKLASEREQSITQLQSDLESRSPTEEDEIVKSLSDDFIGNYKKVQEKYDLPTLATIKELVSEGATVDDKIKLWQEKELAKVIERKHSLEAGEFEYDSNEASKAGTPSYDWDTQTSDKRLDLVSSLKKRQGAERSRLQSVELQQQEDIKWLAENVYENKEIVMGKLDVMNETVDNIAKGEVTADKHPLGVRNLIRGFYHEELLQAAVDKAVKDLTEQFAGHNMHLPTKEMPTDVTDVKAKPPVKELEITDAKRKVSPMLNSIYNTAKK